MSDYLHKPDTGSIFKNDRREKDSQPSGKGSALIGGVEYWISAWTNEAPSGSRYQKLAFEAKPERPPAPEAAAQPSNWVAKDELDDDIPF